MMLRICLSPIFFSFLRARFFLEDREGGKLLTIYYFPPKWIFFSCELGCDAMRYFLLHR